MINRDTYISLGSLILDRLEGRLHFNITDQQRWDLVDKAFGEVVSSEAGTCFKDMYQDRRLRHEFIQQFLAFDEADEFIRDADVEDIEINSTDPVFVHRTNKGFMKTNKKFDDFRYLDFFQRKLIVFAGRKYVRKINDYGLPNIHGRINIVQSPFGPQITITKAKGLPLSIIHLIERGAFDYRTAALLWLAVEGMGLRPANMLIVGGPGAGKTTLLNALLSFVPSNERVVIIEDTLELNTKFMDNFSRLESGEDLSLEYLVKNTLRMRPERVIIGEVRGAEAQDMMTAMNIGKYCMGTIHASDTKEAFARLENAPMNIPSPLINLVDMLVVLRRFRKDKVIRRVIEEISETAFMHQKRPLVSVIRKYDQKKDCVLEVSPFAIFRDKLSQATGLTPVQILDEWDLRAKILYILAQKEIKTFHEVTRFAALYGEDAKEALQSINLTIEAVRQIKLE